MTASDPPPSVLVIGARGALGALVADAFARDGWEVRTAGRAPDPSPAHRYVDLADPGTLEPAMEGMDVVVTTVPDPTLAAERRVLAAGGLLLNLSAGPAAALDELRRGPGPRVGAVVMHAGIAPGVTNLVAAALLGEHPEADEVELVFTVTTKGSGGPASGDFAHRGFIGRRQHRISRDDLPSPFGSRRVLGFAETDRGWLGPVAAGVTVSPYVCLAERPAHELMLALHGTRLISRLPRAALGAGRPATVERASREPVAHAVTVRRRGSALASRLVRGNGDFRMAAASAVVFANSLAMGPRPAARPGAWAPEELVGLIDVEQALHAAGIDVVPRSAQGSGSSAAGR